MRKWILSSLIWSIGLFVFMALVRIILKDEDWLIKTIEWTIPSSLGFFFGYMNAIKDNKKDS